MSVYVGTYKIGKEKVDAWMLIKRKKILLDSNSSAFVSMTEAVDISKQSDETYDEVFALCLKTIKKMGYDIRRGDHISYGFEYEHQDQIIVWMDKGDEEIPNQKAGFGKA